MAFLRNFTEVKGKNFFWKKNSKREAIGKYYCVRVKRSWWQF